MFGIGVWAPTGPACGVWQGTRFLAHAVHERNSYGLGWLDLFFCLGLQGPIYFWLLRLLHMLPQGRPQKVIAYQHDILFGN